MMNDVYLLLGSNIEREKNLPAAVRLLGEMVDIVAVSSVWESLPVGLEEQPSFFNAVVHVRTHLEALALKETVLGHLEVRLHRVRQPDKNAPRTIDADIIVFNEDVFDYDGRHIPDPDVLQFPHAAVPLAELAPGMRHPETGESFQEIADRLLEKETARRGGALPLWRREDVHLRY